MVEFFKNFLVGTVCTAIGVGFVVAVFVTLCQFCWWISGGQIWGLLMFIVISIAMCVGVFFAFDEAKKVQP